MPVTIKRLSDNETYKIQEVGPTVTVKNLKNMIKKLFPPKHFNGCRLVFKGKVLKSKHSLKHYKVKDNDTIDMDDTKNWALSSTSDSEEAE